MPKGVMHTHGSMVSAAFAVSELVGGLNSKDTILSYLPLAHIFERMVEAASTASGTRIGFYQVCRVEMVVSLERSVLSECENV
jgi:long-chain acyl-CoA synthetase